MKHPVAKVDYVELDGLIITMAKDYLPGPYYAPVRDKRVSTIFADGRYFVKTTAAEYDVIILNIGDPYTAQLNRYYTVEFFREVKRVLKAGGVLSFGLGSSESYMNRALRDFLASIYVTLASVFDDVKVIPGETAYFLASGSRGALTYDYDALMARAKERSLDIQYVREYYLSSKLAREKILFMEDALRVPAKINHDFTPISYYFDILFWATRFKDSLYSAVFKIVTERVVWVVTACVAALMLLAGLATRGAGRGFERATLLAVAGNGFSQISLQVVTLVAFQILYGYLFYKLGFVMTAYMAGIALGGWRATRAIPGLKDEKRLIALSIGAIGLYAMALPVIFNALSGLKGGVFFWMGSNVVFALLPLAAGFMGGFLFPLASKVRLAQGSGAGSVAGVNYGADLAGACLGAVLSGAFLIPILGIAKMCYLVAGVNGVVLILIAMSARSYKL